MRQFHRTLVALGLLAVGGSFYVAGCADDCADTLTCGEPPGTDSGSGGSGGSGGSTPLECIPKANQEENKVAVKDDCGVFVRLAGDDLADGTKSKPFATIAHAIEVAKASPTKRVYVCAEIFPESLDIPSGIEIYGGLNCSGGAWAYSGKRTTVAPEDDLVPLTFIREDDSKIHLEDVDARAVDAVKPGGSAIAAIADAVPLELVRSELFAGAGALGEDGTTPEGEVSPTSADDMQIAGRPGNNACMGGGDGNVGPMGTMNPYCMASIGGSGGTGQETLGSNGGDGQPLPDPNPNSFGVGGVGGLGASGCQDGQKGADGAEGTPGSGAKATDLGFIDLGGFLGASGTEGSIGATAQGGGGGGAAKGKTSCFGAAGGSGGAGGCGGKGGTGGKAGGSSIALISVGATLLFTDVKLTTSNGGKGGDGGDGQPGGIGGLGGLGGVPGATGSGTLPACKGGRGGVGGSGGKGGGGRGGHSIGIAWKALAPTALPAGSITIGSPGNGGVGMDPDGNGAAGTAVEVLEIP